MIQYSSMHQELKNKRKEKQQERVYHALDELQRLNISHSLHNDSEIHISHKGNLIKFFPYTGWHTGKGIKDGRGLTNLLNQLK